MADLTKPLETGWLATRKLAYDTYQGALLGGAIGGVISLVIIVRRVLKGQPIDGGTKK